MRYDCSTHDKHVFEACVTAILASAAGTGQHVVVILCDCDPASPHGAAMGFFREDDAVVEVARVSRRVEDRNKAISPAPHVMMWFGEKPGKWCLWEEHYGTWPYSKELSAADLRYA